MDYTTLESQLTERIEMAEAEIKKLEDERATMKAELEVGGCEARFRVGNKEAAVCSFWGSRCAGVMDVCVPPVCFTRARQYYPAPWHPIRLRVSSTFRTLRMPRRLRTPGHSTRFVWRSFKPPRPSSRRISPTSRWTRCCSTRISCWSTASTTPKCPSTTSLLKPRLTSSIRSFPHTRRRFGTMRRSVFTAVSPCLSIVHTSLLVAFPIWIMGKSCACPKPFRRTLFSRS